MDIFTFFYTPPSSLNNIICWRGCLFFHCVFLTSLSIVSSPEVCEFMDKSSFFIPLINVSAFVQMPCHFCYYSFAIQFEVRHHDMSSILLFRIVLWLFSPFSVLKLKIVFTSSMRNGIGIFMGIKQLLVGWPFLFLILLICEHGRSFHPLISSIYFYGILKFLL